MQDIVESVRSFNAGRDPERLSMKLERMRASPFVFLRGTCHRFYERLPKAGPPPAAPLAWICGDAHLENFGTYKGDNRLAYFDINDFDEGALAPASWDVLRFLCSILLAGDTVRATANECLVLCREFVDAYATTLQSGKACWVERATAQGLIRGLLDEVQARRRPEFLDRRTVRAGKQRSIRCDGKHALEVTLTQRGDVTRLIEQFAATQPDPAFFEVLDVARRIAGTGSLGVDRFIVLVRGKGSPDGNYLLDLKQALPSEAQRWSTARQPAWASEAERVVAVQRRMQAVAMAFLNPIAWQQGSYILRALQPSEDRVALGLEGTVLKSIKGAIGSMGHVLASAHLRSSGRQGSAIADQLIAFGAAGSQWREGLIKAAQACSDDVEQEWRAYAAAYDAGAFAAPRKHSK
jgi:uncharacterized protein (DUF2252 family)